MPLAEKLLDELEVTYGKRKPNTSKFGTTSLGEIAEQLCLSNSLISKLTSGNATQGMYERCIKNLKRIQEANRLSKEVAVLKEPVVTLPQKSAYKSLFAIMTALFALSIGFIYTYWQKKPELPHATNFLENYFNPDFNSPSFLPYIPSNQVQQFCPCSGYEGEWQLNKPYVIPVPFNKPGLYFVARSSDIRLKCSTSETPELRGKIMHGFEIMKHELWMDSEQEPLMPKYFNLDQKQYTKEFYNIQFNDNPRYDKVAEISSFFYNRFNIDNDKIKRKGEPAGRYATYVNEAAVTKYKIDLNEILNHVLGDMTKVSCDEITNPYCNPNSLKAGESVLEFNCDFTIKTENLGYGGTYPYTKGFKLTNQHYSNNLLCGCNESD